MLIESWPGLVCLFVYRCQICCSGFQNLIITKEKKKNIHIFHWKKRFQKFFSFLGTNRIACRNQTASSVYYFDPKGFFSTKQNKKRENFQNSSHFNNHTYIICKLLLDAKTAKPNQTKTKLNNNSNGHHLSVYLHYSYTMHTCMSSTQKTHPNFKMSGFLVFYQ